MDEAVRIVIIAVLTAIVLLTLYTKRKAKKFEAQHTGIYKTKIMMRGLNSLFLLAFAAASLLALKGIVGPVPGIILMAIVFICWLPFQVMLYTMLSLDEQGAIYMNPLRGKKELPWHDVKSVSVSPSGILIKSGDENIMVRSFFSGYEEIKDTIKEKCPDAVNDL